MYHYILAKYTWYYIVIVSKKAYYLNRLKVVNCNTCGFLNLKHL